MKSELRPEHVSANPQVLAYYAQRESNAAGGAAKGVGGGGGGATRSVTVTEAGPLGMILTQKKGRVLVANIVAGKLLAVRDL